jgi:hypothetical protein
VRVLGEVVTCQGTSPGVLFKPPRRLPVHSRLKTSKLCPPPPAPERACLHSWFGWPPGWRHHTSLVSSAAAAVLLARLLLLPVLHTAQEQQSLARTVVVGERGAGGHEVRAGDRRGGERPRQGRDGQQHRRRAQGLRPPRHHHQDW